MAAITKFSREEPYLSNVVMHIRPKTVGLILLKNFSFG